MLGDPAPARENAVPTGAVLTVSALNRSIRDLLEHRFPLVWVGGEISNFTQARSGHLYFSLKDDQAQVRCVMFRSRGLALDWQPREGMRVEVRATATLYEPRGDLQLNVEFMRPAGLGALFEAFLRLRDRLQRPGLFDPALKRPVPAYPRAVGIVTSLSAAALRDVLTTLARRNPSISAVVYPSGVQGESGPGEIGSALAGAGAASRPSGRSTTSGSPGPSGAARSPWLSASATKPTSRSRTSPLTSALRRPRPPRSSSARRGANCWRASGYSSDASSGGSSATSRSGCSSSTICPGGSCILAAGSRRRVPSSHSCAAGSRTPRPALSTGSAGAC